ncbi:hypothetical protein [uncultured Roseibium sp.]|uniref:hypothetical protein n=1 Tax=uncultured Roseibium sp. TaxID=1936171 RepID=UPI003216A46B
MDKLLEQLQDIWPLAMQAPWGFATITILVVTISWTAGRFMFGERLKTLNARLEARNELIGEYEKKIKILGENYTQPKSQENDYAISEEQIKTAKTIAKTLPGKISLRHDMTSYSALQLTEQIYKIFKESGWGISKGIVITDDLPDEGMALSISQHTTASGRIALAALKAAELKFAIREEDLPDDVDIRIFISDYPTDISNRTEKY